MNPGPSIILVTSDQHRGDCFGFEGHSVKTPHLDFLARNGSWFADPAFASVAAELTGMQRARPDDVRTPPLPVVGRA